MFLTENHALLVKIWISLALLRITQFRFFCYALFKNVSALVEQIFGPKFGGWIIPAGLGKAISNQKFQFEMSNLNEYMVTQMSSNQSIHPTHSFHRVDTSPWPARTSLSVFGTVLGAVMYFHQYPAGGTVRVFGFLFRVICAALWWRDVYRESAMVHHTHRVQRGLQYEIFQRIVNGSIPFVGLILGFFLRSITVVSLLFEVYFFQQFWCLFILWLNFLSLITKVNPELAKYIQRQIEAGVKRELTHHNKQLVKAKLQNQALRDELKELKNRGDFGKLPNSSNSPFNSNSSSNSPSLFTKSSQYWKNFEFSKGGQSFIQGGTFVLTATSTAVGVGGLLLAVSNGEKDSLIKEKDSQIKTLSEDKSSLQSSNEGLRERVDFQSTRIEELKSKLLASSFKADPVEVTQNTVANMSQTPVDTTPFLDTLKKECCNKVTGDIETLTKVVSSVIDS